MKKNDNQFVEMLRDELNSIEIPESLEKDNMVKMLKEKSEKDFSDKTGNIISLDAERDNASKKRTNIIGRAAATAAALAVVVASLLFINSRTKVDVIKTKPAYNNYDAQQLIKGAQSYDEVEQAVQQILGKPDRNTNTSDPENSEAVTSVGSEGANGGYVAQSPQEIIINDSVLIDIKDFTDVDADIVRNNGEYIFIVATEDGSDNSDAEKQVVKIVKAYPADEMSVVSSVILADNSNPNIKEKCIEIYLQDNMLVALMERNSSLSSDSQAYNKDLTVAVYYDISDPEAPVKLREHVQDGRYVSSYFTESSLCLVTDRPIVAEEDVSLPSYSINGVVHMPKAEEIFMSVNDPEASYILITATNTSDFSLPVECVAFLGGSGNGTYICKNSVIVTRVFVSVDADENGVHNSLTEIYRFDIIGSGAVFAGSYSVDGLLSDAPFVSTENGNLIALATEQQSTTLYVLDKDMQLTGKLEGIFPGERIKNFLCFDTKCYVVAGEENETTLIIDLSDPENPIKEETLSTDGFATMLYKAGDNLFLRINVFDTDGLSFSLLDLADPEGSLSYTQSDLSAYGTAGGNESVMVIEDQQIFGIPVISENSDGCAYALFDFSGGEIVPLGCFSHGTEIAEGDIRGSFIDGILYIVSGEKITAYSVTDESRIADIYLD